jgi:DNA-binding MarR family transcriptional regulator
MDTSDLGRGGLRDEELETSRLLVEFLHAAYATRRLDQPGADVEPGRPGAHDPRAAGAMQGDDRLAGGSSAHVIRAAIHVYQHGDRTVSQLAAGLGISLGWASRVADELVERGHAVRERDPNDRRVVRLRMTESALEEIERAYRWRGDVVGRTLAEHSPSERAAIRRFLRRVTDEMTAEAARRAGDQAGLADQAGAAGQAGLADQAGLSGEAGAAGHAGLPDQASGSPEDAR